MTISILSELDRGEFEVAFFLTYTLNLRFFEALVLPRLRRLGVTRMGILTDEKGYQDSLEDPLAQEWCGRAYLVAPARLTRGGIQHAKLLWLQGPREAVAYIGSHNLTMAGYNDQVELTARLTSKNPGHIQALRDIHAAVSRVVPDQLQSVWRYTNPPPDADTPPLVRFLSSLDAPLGDQLAGAVGRSTWLRVVTPFLDAPALGRLAEQVGATFVTVDVPFDGADTPLAAVAGPFRTLRHLTKQRRLHAKAFEFTGAQSTTLAIGSANCTQAALERGVEAGGNLEFLIVVDGATLPTEGIEFLEVTDPSTFPYTGRNWDAARPTAVPIRIDRAEYRADRLEVHWTTSHSAALQQAWLRVDNQEVPCTASPMTVALAAPPSVVTLRATIAGQTYEAKAWVEVPEHLAAQTVRPVLRQLEEHLLSDNPIHQADGVAALLAFIVRDLSQTDQTSGELSAAQVASPATSSEASNKASHDLHEAIALSPDPDRLRVIVGRLLSGRSPDPMAILRALIARLASDVPLALQSDLDSVEHHGRLKQLAKQRLAEMLVRHYELLASDARDWVGTPSQRITSCLDGTFGATALIWHHELGHDAPDQVRARFAEAFVRLLERLLSIREVRPLLALLQVVGPLALSLGAVAEAAREDDFLLDRLRRMGRELLGENPSAILQGWRETCHPQADILLAGARGNDVFIRWKAPILRLLGVTPDHVRSRIEQRWGPLLELQKADQAESPGRDELYRAAEARYSGTDVWLSYLTARRSGRLPLIAQVAKPQCDRCYTPLPTQKARRLTLGDAVVCDCRRILVQRT